MPTALLREDDDVQAREALILGQPPRIAPLEPADYPPGAYGMAEGEHEVAVGQQAAAQWRERDPARPLSDHTATLMRHPDLYRAQMTYGLQLNLRSALPPRDRELLILRTGWLCQAPFEWGEHVHIAKRVGLTSEEIERVTQGPDAAGWDEHDRALLRAADELHRDAMISDATWAVLSRRLDERQMIELPCVVGHYHLVAFYQNSLRMRPRAENRGLAAR
jgi:alkylhydroperoxidase family enzyme